MEFLSSNVGGNYDNTQVSAQDTSGYPPLSPQLFSPYIRLRGALCHAFQGGGVRLILQQCARALQARPKLFIMPLMLNRLQPVG